jgi:hypothetical protein
MSLATLGDGPGVSTAAGAAGKARASFKSGIASDARGGRAGSSPAPGIAAQNPARFAGHDDFVRLWFRFER